MSGRTFVDTNVLIYAHDVDAGQKHEIARNVLRELWSEREGVLSMQVLQEFYVNVTRKIATPLPRVTARTIVESYRSWCVQTTTEEIATAFRIEDEAHLGFWGALVVAASKSGAVRLYLGRPESGANDPGVRVENPFAAG